MGGFEQGLCTSVLVLLASVITCADRGRIYMVTSPPSMQMPLYDETVLTCEMNISPDRFRWRYYPLGDREASNPKAHVNLAKHRVIDIPYYKEEKKFSYLNVKFTNKSVAGDYQCLAYYGASVIASIPGRITLTSLEEFPKQKNISVVVTEGNTVIWRCDPPMSNPTAYIEYMKNDRYYESNYSWSTDSLILDNVTINDSGVYKCKAGNLILSNLARYSDFSLHLRVVKRLQSQPPTFILPPKLNYTVRKGDDVFIECGAVGNPTPKVTWQKSQGTLPQNRMELVPGFGLRIKNVTSSDDGVYICEHSNSEGVLPYRITLIYNEAPKVVYGPKSTNMREGHNLELNCTVTGTPEPTISWFLNGESVLNDGQIEAIGNKIYFNPLEKRHAGILQCFASNIVSTDYGSADLNVIPRQINGLETPFPVAPKRRKHKNKKPKLKPTAQMTPPVKPNVTRVSDESVVVRWSVPPNDGLPIQFFKVQYRELGHYPQTKHDDDYSRSSQKAKWKTINQDIAPNIMSYEVINLKPDHQYKFRIAAVYSNNDNKLSPKSDKFTLTRGDFFIRNPLPVPNLTHTEALNATAIRVFWEYTPSPNISIDGFFINYISASNAGDYTKVSVDGEYVNNYVITHLQPDTVYDIKMQSFTTKSASEFTQILKQKTHRLPTEPPVTTSMKPEQEKASEIPQKYIFIGGGAAVVALLITIVVSLIICKRWKRKKNLDNTRDKATVEEVNHHIQADGNNYVATPKSLPRSNGCVPSNRITITANPLADADNKNSNMIEMSCLSSQNNNCSVTQPSASSEETNGPRNKEKHKHKEKNKRNKNLEPVQSAGENYV